MQIVVSLSTTQIYNELTTAYGQYVVSYRTSARWFKRFSNEREGLECGPRSSRPITALLQQNIDVVNALVNNDPHISIDYIATILDTVITSLIVNKKIKVIAGPRYSLDLTLSNFWVFNYLKRDLGNYPDDTSLAKAITKTLKSTPIHEYQRTFQKWIERMKLYIEHHEDYFEHLL
ncbi:unnamed protein product [Adineta steineri]|uniref:Mos1 transposase HTH domain-containing protein n=1 Tax=Adineta steineri TaxID=433720 RepID=A0A818Z2R4_9BILA|nr:unnamed protein product [Adineta steineri]CAF3762828.1 unnamed protein product [Adineta steineri]